MIQKRITTGAEWRKTRENGVEVTLPSGHTAALRNINLAALLVKGVIPDPLTGTVMELINGGKTAERMKPEQMLRATAALQEAVCKLAFVNPKVVDEPQTDNEIHIDDVAFIDQEFVLRLLQTPVEVLAKSQFLQEQSPTVEPVSEGEAIQNTAI
jgi:hypothetical protein